MDLPGESAALEEPDYLSQGYVSPLLRHGALLLAQKTSPASSPTAVSPKPKRASKWGAVKTEMVDKPKEEVRSCEERSDELGIRNSWS